MHRRILFGVAAWLLGAATATAGSLLAISLLGQGITGNSGQLLTQDAVTRALASEAAEAPPSAAARDTGSPTAPARTAPAASAGASGTDVPATDTTTTGSPPGDGTVLTSAGGEVVASCQAAGAYLISWSPLQGYAADDVNRGPAAAARVTFESTTQRVTMVVSCSAGVPSATSYSGGVDN